MLFLDKVQKNTAASSPLSQRFEHPAAANLFSKKTTVFAPAHWALEVANGRLMAERRKRLSAADAAAALNFLRQLPVTIDQETAERAFAEIPGFARQYELTAYDAAYLELAMRHRASLTTLDEPLRRAAVAAGVPLL